MMSCVPVARRSGFNRSLGAAPARKPARAQLSNVCEGNNFPTSPLSRLPNNWRRSRLFLLNGTAASSQLAHDVCLHACVTQQSSEAGSLAPHSCLYLEPLTLTLPLPLSFFLGRPLARSLACQDSLLASDEAKSVARVAMREKLAPEMIALLLNCDNSIHPHEPSGTALLCSPISLSAGAKSFTLVAAANSGRRREEDSGAGASLADWNLL